MSYRDLLRPILERDEKRVLHVYPDSRGYWTIGVGHLVDPRVGGKISNAVADLMLTEDIDSAERDARHLVPDFEALTDIRKTVVTSMAFNLGQKGLAGFPKFLNAVNERRWADAAVEMLSSLWAKQVHDRADRLAYAMEHDRFE